MSSPSGRGAGLDENGKPCRACTDFKSWMKSQKTRPSTTQSDSPKKNVKNESGEIASEAPSHDDCPLDKSELGRNTWSFLHTMAEYYPNSPSTSEKADMKKFITTLSQFYPCDYCAKDFRNDLKSHEPNVSSTHGLSQYFCELHNRVNLKLGKPVFDCSKTKQRWKDGWSDGRCD